MKKSLKFVLLFSTYTTLISCSKKASQMNEWNNLTNATKQTINARSIIEIKQRYALLTNEEKQILWDTKWNAILKNDANKLTSDQLKIVMMIKTFVDTVTIERLYKNPTPGEAFIKANLPYFEKDFSNAQLYLLIECPYFCENFSLLNSSSYTIPMDPDAPPGERLCQCYYSISCSISGDGVCMDGGCKPVSGCGLTGTSNCTGVCK